MYHVCSQDHLKPTLTHLKLGDTMTPLEQFQRLLNMAAADQRMHEAELGFLAERAMELGVTQDKFHDALQVAIRGEGELRIPTGAAARRALLKDLIRMMAADGEIAMREKELFAQVAATMEIETDELHRIIDATLAEFE